MHAHSDRGPRCGGYVYLSLRTERRTARNASFHRCHGHCPMCASSVQCNEAATGAKAVHSECMLTLIEVRGVEGTYICPCEPNGVPQEMPVFTAATDIAPCAHRQFSVMKRLPVQKLFIVNACSL